MKHLTSYGYVVGVLQQVPGPPNTPHFANTLHFIDEEIVAADNWISNYVDNSQVAVGGHSFGGVSASQIIFDDPDRVNAIVYFASFPFLVPVIGQDVTQFKGKMLNIAGSEDVTSEYSDILNGYNAYNTTFCKAFYTIEGLGHAGFGDYSHPNQTVGSIGRTNATATIRHLLVSFMESIFKNTDLGKDQFLIEMNYPNTILEFDNDCIKVLDVEDIKKHLIMRIKS